MIHINNIFLECAPDEGASMEIDPNEKIRIPDYIIDYREISKFMKINVDILKKELTEHIDKEIERFKMEIENVTKNVC